MTSKRSRIFLAILLIYAAGTAFLLYRVLADLDPRYRESAEESLVDTAQVLASLVEQDVRDGAIDTSRLAPLFQSVYGRRFEARIFSLTKNKVDLRMVVTDRSGRVLFDSLGRATGADYSRWNEVLLALRGEYGARTTADTPDQPHTSVMYVAAPVRWNQSIVGVVSVGKPVQSFGQFVEAARRKTLYVGVLSAVGVALLALIVSVWVVRPLGLLTDFARYVRSQRRLHPASLARVAVGIVREAFEEMRDALAGRNYVADYVQTLTHELKSPLSAIRGASELLQDPAMPPAQRQKFLDNIARETGRIQEVVDRMMELTLLETRRSLAHVQPVALGPLLDEVLAAARDAAAPRKVRIVREGDEDVTVEGRPLSLAAGAQQPGRQRHRLLAGWRRGARRPGSRPAAGGAARARPGSGCAAVRAREGVREVLFAGASRQRQEEHRPGPELRTADRLAAPWPHRAGERGRRGRRRHPVPASPAVTLTPQPVRAPAPTARTSPPAGCLSSAGRAS
jgi:two-component system sensor histidine kinase CreC